jgi:ankyrin repeat protein
MTSHVPSPLPERPNLEHLKKAAKSLLHAARAGDAGALERFRLLPAFSKKSAAELRDAGLALHDAQSVIAREHGFQSWNALREHVEERSLSFAAAVDEFVRCATGSAAARAQRLLALHPGIAHASLQTELVRGDADAVKARLRADPGLATQAGGIQDWEPLLYVCHTCLHHEAPERAAGLVSIAAELLDRGANPNAEYHWQWHPELPRTALWAALFATSDLRLAELLLQRGAIPTDGVSAHIAAGSGNVKILDLLHRYRMDPNGIPGGVPPLRYILSWAENDTAGVQWLLEHGADPNLVWNEHGDAPIHVAAQRWDVPMMELLARHGADLHQRRRDGRTALTIAELQGNAAVAAWLRARGAKDELSPLERFVAACANGDRASAETMLRGSPQLRTQLRAEHHLLTQVPAERGDVAVLETMLTCGFDPNVRDHDGVTALHRASMAGRVDAARVLLAHGAATDPLDGMFAAPPLVWAAEGMSHPRPGGDHLALARLLITAGSPTTWTPPEKAPDPEGTQEALAELCRAAAATEGA